MPIEYLPTHHELASYGVLNGKRKEELQPRLGGPPAFFFGARAVAVSFKVGRTDSLMKSFRPPRLQLHNRVPQALSYSATPLYRGLIAAPGPNAGPLMTRRADRELPGIDSNRRWFHTIPIFAVIVGAAMLGIFNYQKSSSSVVSSTLYALRTSSKAREVLGDEVYFAQKIPWISGEMDQLHGRIDITFWVKGTKGKGRMRFKSVRENRMSFVSSLLAQLFSYCAGFLQISNADLVPD